MNDSTGPLDDVELRLLTERWYCSIELAPGVVTRGAGHRNVALTRDLLRHAGLEGSSCLDIGTMEGLVPVLMCRRGAATVVATDVGDESARIACVKRRLGVDFQYLPGLTIDATRQRLSDLGHGRFDVVVLSGVLYHVFSPMSVLAVARSLVRVGGLIILETMAAVDDAYTLRFNAGGCIGEGANLLWVPSVAWLQYVLRYFRMAAIDCVFFGYSRWARLKQRVGYPGFNRCRIGVVCRAVDHVLPDASDTWMQCATDAPDYALLAEPASDTNPSLAPYHRQPPAQLMRGPSGTCDLLATIRSGSPLPVHAESSVLRLGALH